VSGRAQAGRRQPSSLCERTEQHPGRRGRGHKDDVVVRARGLGEEVRQQLADVRPRRRRVGAGAIERGASVGGGRADPELACAGDFTRREARRCGQCACGSAGHAALGRPRRRPRPAANAAAALRAGRLLHDGHLLVDGRHLVLELRHPHLVNRRRGGGAGGRRRHVGRRHERRRRRRRRVFLAVVGGRRRRHAARPAAVPAGAKDVQLCAAPAPGAAAAGGRVAVRRRRRRARHAPQPLLDRGGRREACRHGRRRREDDDGRPRARVVRGHDARDAPSVVVRDDRHGRVLRKPRLARAVPRRAPPPGRGDGVAPGRRDWGERHGGFGSRVCDECSKRTRAPPRWTAAAPWTSPRVLRRRDAGKS
jgi:hypothetical protein